MVTVDGSVDRSGQYKYILHYYQHEHPTFDLDVIVEVDGKQYNGNTMRILKDLHKT